MNRQIAEWEKTDLAKECVRLYGWHRRVVHQFGEIGFAEYCTLCGCGRWVNIKNEVRLEEGIHKFTVPTEG